MSIKRGVCILLVAILLSLINLGYNISDYVEETPWNSFSKETKGNWTGHQRPSSLKSWWRGQDGNASRYSHHPNQGAEFNGRIGMIIDPSVERLRSFLDLSDDEKNELIDPLLLCPRKGDGTLIESEGGNKVLQKIKNGIRKSKKYINSTNSNRYRHSKVLCMIYTVNIPGDNHTNLRSIAHTWGRKCDGFIAASNSTDHSLGAINLLHLGQEKYGNMWQKVRSMWAYAYNHYINEYDFFFICGDDTYVSIENMRAYIDGPEVYRLENGYQDNILKVFITKNQSTGWDAVRPRPLYLATPMTHRKGRSLCPFAAGGGGYLLNRAALELFGTRGISTWLANNTDPREDVFMGSFYCSQGLYLADTRNADDGGCRFCGTARACYDRTEIGQKDLKTTFGFKIVTGIDSCSEQQISFHLKDDKSQMQNYRGGVSLLNYRYEAVFNDWCDS